MSKKQILVEEWIDVGVAGEKLLIKEFHICRQNARHCFFSTTL
jgi:hypothetical protein